MSQPKPNSNQNNPQSIKNSGFNENIIQQFLENQKSQLVIEAETLKLKQEELRINSRLAEKSMELQAKHLGNQPSEGRKSITRVAYIIAGFVILLFGFIGFCLYLGKDIFVLNFLKNAGYVFTTLMGYWFGRRVGKENERKSRGDVINEVEVVDP